MDARKDWDDRVRHARVEAHARALGLDVTEYRAALSVACRSWLLRAPWRFLPAPVGGIAWDLFGGRYAGRFVRRWANG